MDAMDDDEDYEAIEDVIADQRRIQMKKQTARAQKERKRSFNGIRSDEDLFIWSEEEYELKALYGRPKVLPVVVIIKGGFYGDTPWETVSSGDVLYLHSKGRQPRGMAMDCTYEKRCYSIPLDYTEPFVKYDPKHSLIYKSKAQTTLGQVIQKERLPCKVTMCSKRRSKFLGEGYTSDLTLENFEIQDTYEEKFFKANSVFSGALYHQPIALPIYLRGVTVSLAMGMALDNDNLNYKDGLDQKMAEYKRTAATMVDYAPVVPTREITVFNYEAVQSCEGIYDTIEPVAYVKLEKTQAAENVYTPLSPDVEQSSHQPLTQSSPQPIEGRRKSLIQEITERLQKDVQKGSQPLDRLQKDVQKGGQPLDRPQPPPKPSNMARRQTINKPKKEAPPIGYLPDDITKLDTDELVECLHSLKLEDLEPIFRENQIDGELLSNLNEEMMRKDLKIGSFQAMKLNKFVHEGWRPSDYTTI